MNAGMIRRTQLMTEFIGLSGVFEIVDWLGVEGMAASFELDMNVNHMVQD